jgi:hypothetical protein
LVTGGEAFNFRAQSPINCALIDGETLKEVFEDRLKQFDLTAIPKNIFFPISKLDLSADSPWASFDITNNKYRDLLSKFITDNKIRCVVLDNLTTLSKPGAPYIQAAIGGIFEWAQSWSSRDKISVILVHHANDDNSPRGSAELEIRSHTEISLIGRDQICEDNLGPANVQKCAKESGTTVGMLFKVCKSAPILERRIYWFHCPFGESSWQALGVTDAEGELLENEVYPEQVQGNMDSSTNADATYMVNKTESVKEITDNLINKSDSCVTADIQTLHNLSDDENKAYQRIKLGACKREDIDEALGCNREKLRNILNSLINKKLIHTSGDGKNTIYTI